MLSIFKKKSSLMLLLSFALCAGKCKSHDTPPATTLPAQYAGKSVSELEQALKQELEQDIRKNIQQIQQEIKEAIAQMKVTYHQYYDKFQQWRQANPNNPDEQAMIQACVPSNPNIPFSKSLIPLLSKWTREGTPFKTGFKTIGKKIRKNIVQRNIQHLGYDPFQVTEASIAEQVEHALKAKSPDDVDKLQHNKTTLERDILQQQLALALVNAKLRLKKKK